MGRQPLGGKGLERCRVVQLPVDRLAEQILTLAIGTELARAGVLRRLWRVDRRAEHHRRTEELRIGHRVAQRPGTTHRVPRDRPAGPIGDGPVRRIDVWHQVVDQRRLDRSARILALVRRIDVVAPPAAPGSVGHHRDRRRDVAVADQLVEAALRLGPGGHRVAPAVQQVDHRIAVGRGVVPGGQVDVVPQLLTSVLDRNLASVIVPGSAAFAVLAGVAAGSRKFTRRTAARAGTVMRMIDL